jgi:hypothetical protein
MDNVIAHLVWGSVLALIPLVYIISKYYQTPTLVDKLSPFEILLQLTALIIVVNLFLMTLVAPYLRRQETLLPYTNLILGVIAGSIYAYFITRFHDSIVGPVLGIKNQRNLYAVLIFWFVLAYAVFMPMLQRRVAVGPKGY